MIKDSLKSYLSFQQSFQKVDDSFRIPSTHIEIKALELDEDVLMKHGEHFVKIIHDINQRIEDIEVRVQIGDAPKRVISGAEMLDSWRSLFNFPIDQNSLYLRKDMKEQGVQTEEIYARLAHKIFKEDIPRRGFRLHFSGVRVPLSVSMNGKICVLHLELKSLSKECLLFQLKEEDRKILNQAHFAQIHLSPSGLFRASDDRVASEIPAFVGDCRFSSRPFERPRLASFEVNLRELTTYSSHLDAYRNDDSLYTDNFLRVPLASLQDPCLLTSDESIVEYFSRKIDEVEENLYYLIAS